MNIYISNKCLYNDAIKYTTCYYITIILYDKIIYIFLSIHSLDKATEYLFFVMERRIEIQPSFGIWMTWKRATNIFPSDMIAFANYLLKIKIPPWKIILHAGAEYIRTHMYRSPYINRFHNS